MESNWSCLVCWLISSGKSIGLVWLINWSHLADQLVSSGWSIGLIWLINWSHLVKINWSLLVNQSISPDKSNCLFWLINWFILRKNHSKCNTYILNAILKKIKELFFNLIMYIHQNIQLNIVIVWFLADKILFFPRQIRTHTLGILQHLLT